MSLIKLLERYPLGHPYKRCHAAYTKEWCYSNLSTNPSLTWDYVSKNPGYPSGHYKHNSGYSPWIYFSVAKNETVTLDIMKKNLDRIGNFYAASKNPNITWDDVKDSRIPWNFRALSSNRNITF